MGSHERSEEELPGSGLDGFALFLRIGVAPSGAEERVRGLELRDDRSGESGVEYTLFGAT